MRVPTRKSEEDRRALAGEPDRYLTPDAIERLKQQRKRLEEEHPAAKLELQRAQEMGDLSENFAYQEAKRRLRSINDRIVSIGERIAQAIPIDTRSGGDVVQIGSKVTLESNGRRFAFDILGSQETDPTRGRISYRSPLGVVLMGKAKGETATVQANGRDVAYLIIDIA